MKGNPKIAALMLDNDRSVEPPRQSSLRTLNPDGSEVWEDEDTYIRVWPSGMMTETPK